MKRTKLIILILICTITLGLLSSCNTKEDFIRIHIRANSNEIEDQNVKLKVRDALIEYLTPKLAEADNTRDAQRIISDKVEEIEVLARDVLLKNGFFYTVKAEIKIELFPTRDYNGLTLESGNYTALIIGLGDAVGDNWWCVAYPPLCFVPQTEGKNIEYKSKILEIIEAFFDKK